jgi:hypothetical protein
MLTPHGQSLTNSIVSLEQSERGSSQGMDAGEWDYDVPEDVAAEGAVYDGRPV